MPSRKGLLAPQNTFLDTIATRFDGTHSNFVLGNAKVSTSYPIVYCSDGFCELTGYARAQIMQKSCACRFLYGSETSEADRVKIDTALDNRQELKLEVTFYRKNGIPFCCLLDIVPIKNEKREVVLFLASHKDITPSQLSSSCTEEQWKEDGLVFGENEASRNELDVEAPPANYDRRRSRAVLYQLSGHYRQETKSKLKLSNMHIDLCPADVEQKQVTTHGILSNQLDLEQRQVAGPGMKSNPDSQQRQVSPPVAEPEPAAFPILQPGTTAPLPEYKSTAVKRSKFVLSHYGVFKSCWDWLVLVATFYVAVVVPYNASFVLRRNRPSVVSDVLVETLFIFDIVLNFRTTYVNKKGEVVSSPSSIAVNYLKGWLIVDLLSALPFDVMFAADVYSSETPIHLLKLTRLLRLFRLLQKFDRYTRYSSMILALLLLLFSLAAHWLACVWYVIAERERLQHPDDWKIGWIPQLADRLHIPVDNLTIELSYVTALYFTCTSLTSVGFGNVSANTYSEKIFSVVVMLVGALMHAAVFGNVAAIVQRMYAKRSQYDSKWNDLRDFMALYQIPKELHQRILDYFQTMWSMNHGIEMTEILKDFPEELRGDVCMHIHRELLQLPIFMTASLGCQKLLALQIKDSFCAPGEYLVHRGDALHCIFYLCNGSMEVVQSDMVVAILGKGDLVGCDIEHLMQDGSDIVVKSSSDVRALTYCDLKCLHIPGLVDVLKLYEDFQQEFSKDIQHDLTYNLREGFEADAESDVEVSAGLSHMLPSISEDNEEEMEEAAVGLVAIETENSPARSAINSRRVSEDIETIGGRSCHLDKLLPTFSGVLSPLNHKNNSESSNSGSNPANDVRFREVVQRIDTQVSTAVKLLEQLSRKQPETQMPAPITSTCHRSAETPWSPEVWLRANRSYALQLLGISSQLCPKCRTLIYGTVAITPLGNTTSTPTVSVNENDVIFHTHQSASSSVHLINPGDCTEETPLQTNKQVTDF